MSMLCSIFDRPISAGEPCICSYLLRHLHPSQKSLEYAMLRSLSSYSFRLTMALIITGTFVGCATEASLERASQWVNLYTGEPTDLETIIEDLAIADVTFLGEFHTVERHHRMQKAILDGLIESHGKVILGLEMLERTCQEEVDRFNRGEWDFDRLARETDWAERWPNYKDYQLLLEATRQAGGTVLALNAPLEVVRKTSGVGIDGLPEEMRRQLPAMITLDEPPYYALLKLQMEVHGGMTESWLEKMYEAQVVRDATMADTLAAHMQEYPGQKAVVVCGAGHCSYGYGMVSRLKARLPEAVDRIVLMSESGDVTLPPEIMEYINEIEITHQQYRDIIDAPLGDYLLVTEYAE